MEQEKHELLNDRLSDLHKGKLFAFNQDKDMMDAVEKALLFMIYEMGTLKKEDSKIHDVNWGFIPHNTNTTDEMLGRELRAKIAGLSFMDDAFKQIKRFGLEKAKTREEVNPAV